MNKQELNRFIDKISPTGPGGIEKIKRVLKAVLDREGEEGITEEELIEALTTKQDTLVSGTNIKTVNNTSLLGSGNIAIPKGDKGDKGDTGPQGPQGPQGLKGDTGVSADYPITIYNGLDSDATDQALSAAQGKVLDGKVSQLEAKLIEIREHGENHYYIRSSGGTYSWYSAGDTMLSRYVKVLPGDIITVVKNSERNAYIAFVASVDTSLTPVFANGTSSINAAVSNQTFQVTEECYFWWMVQYNTSQLYEPSVLTLNGQSILNGIYRVDKLSNIEQELAAIQQETAPNVYTYGEVLGGYFNTDGTWRAYNANCQYVELKAGDKVHIKGGHDYGSRIAFVSGDVVVGTTLVFANGTSAAITLNSEEEKDYNIIEDCNLVWIGEITFSALNIQDWNPESVLVNGISYDGTWKEQIAKNATDLAEINKDDSEIMNIVINSNIAKYYQKGASPKSFQSEKKIAILCAGQSNAEGRVPYADMPAEIKSAQPIANCHYVEDSVSGAFSSLNITGLWAFDLVTYYNLCVTANKEIYVMKWAEGGTSIDPLGDSTNHWTADYEKLSSENNSLLRKFETEIRNHIASDGEYFDIRAMLWHQGEGDRGSLGTGSDDRYYENLRNMVSYIRGIVGNERLPFITGTISHNSAQYDAEIEAAQQRIASEDPYFCLIDMSGAPLLDSYHFNAASSKYFGEMAYNALIDFGVLSATKLTPTRPW